MEFLTKVLVIFTIICISPIFAFPDHFHQRRPRLDPGRIVGGVPVDIKDFPYQVSLQYYESHLCGGSIISEHFILTASHCTTGLQEYQLSVRLGSTRHGSGGIVLPVEMIINHPNYDMETIDYDYSLLKLGKTIVFHDFIKAVKLPEKNETVEDGADCAVSGWGDTKSATESNDILRVSIVPKVNFAECYNSYREFGGITKRMMCAGFMRGGHDACQGDSGGPLVSGDKLVGIVSWGHGCAKQYYPGVYSDVAVVRDWIAEQSRV